MRMPQMKKCAIHFASRTVPLYWVLGLASILIEHVRRDSDSSLLLLACSWFVIPFVVSMSVADLKINGVRGWWAFGASVAGFGVFTLSTWLFFPYV